MKKVLLDLFMASMVAATDAQIYQFRGPHRDGKFPETIS